MPNTKKNTYHDAWERENIRKFPIKFNKQTEKELVDWLEKKSNRQAYVKSLIEADMKASKRTETDPGLPAE